ncbi:7401_t:CDS:2 [Diversispora eburnea]|uniref:7401_t:CDS:1 n=1 Tax=Diversispora eburnea TaxID=1213867 RepID=A0A9N8VEM3_9GLOM|nr:7401_t:CDS:2 [Diversispora eburnea]
MSQKSCPPPAGYYSLIVRGSTFKLSASSLYSDSPNYFTDAFNSLLEESVTKTLVIDRDPTIFSDIVKHLQGYYVTPRDEVHYTDLYSDAQYYRLPKLKEQLRTNYIVNVGGKVFRVEREVLEKRDAPNFFTSFGFGYGWEPILGEPMIPQFPSLPPPILERDPELFADILRYLQGYEIGIKDEVHRQNLLKDARFYHLKGLTDKLLASTITVNGFSKDDFLSELDLKKLKNITKSIKVSEKINMIIQSTEMCAFEIDGAKVTSDALTNVEKLAPLMKLDDNTGNQYLSLFVTKAILRLNVNNDQIEMELLKCEAFSSERGFNGKRIFLPSDKRISL